MLSQKDQAAPTEADLEKRMAEYGDFKAEGRLPISFPADVDIQGEYMLVPDLHARVLIFDGKNKIRGNPSTWVDGKFVHPHDACFDKDGNIFVTEWVEAGRVTFLKRV
jgi:hypothetical protein